MSASYSVAVTGKIVDGFELAQVKASVSKLFKLNGEQVEKIFSGKPVVIRRAVEKEQAVKLRSALVKVGALAVVKEAATQTVAEKPQQTVTAAPAAVVKEGFRPDIHCPRCGHQQSFVTACGLCKMDLTLHIQRLKRKERARANRLKARAQA